MPKRYLKRVSGLLTSVRSDFVYFGKSLSSIKKSRRRS